MAQFSGAFDLSQVAAASTKPTTGSFVTEVTEATFDATMRKSISYPIVVEFYSSQAPESQTMGQLLGDLANAAGGSWLLARMNIDTSPQIVQALKITAVPLVVGVLGGQLMPLWQGSVTKEQASAVISQLLQMAAGNGILGKAEPQQGQADTATAADGDGESQEDPKYTPAYDAMGEGDYAKAEQEFAKLLGANPADAEAKIGKAQAGLLGRVSALNPAQVMQAAEGPDPSLEAIMNAADLEVASGNVAQGFARMISAISSASAEDRETLRLRLLELFDTQNPSDKAVLDARRGLATALF